MVRDQRRHRGQQRLERFRRSRASASGSAADRVADRLTDVGVEQIDRAHGQCAERRVRVARERRAAPRPAARTRAGAAPCAPPRRRRSSSAPRRRRARPTAIPSRSTAWINDAGTPDALGQLVQREGRRRATAGVAASHGNGCGQVCVGGGHLAVEHPADRREGQALRLQFADPSDPTRRARRRTRRAGPRARAAGAVRATGRSARCRPTRRRSPRAVPPGTARVNHSTSAHSHLHTGRSTDRRAMTARIRCAPCGTPPAASASWWCSRAPFGTVALGTATKAPCASGHYGDGRQYRLPLLHGRRAAARHRAARRADGCRSSTRAPRARTTATSTRCSRCT